MWITIIQRNVITNGFNLFGNIISKMQLPANLSEVINLINLDIFIMTWACCLWKDGTFHNCDGSNVIDQCKLCIFVNIPWHVSGCILGGNIIKAVGKSSGPTVKCAQHRLLDIKSHANSSLCENVQICMLIQSLICAVSFFSPEQRYMSSCHCLSLTYTYLTIACYTLHISQILILF